MLYPGEKITENAIATNKRIFFIIMVLLFSY